MNLPVLQQWFLLVPVGFAVGVLGGFVGLGGGFALVPILLLLFKLDPPAAAATSLFVIFFSAAAGGIVQVRQRRVDWKMGLAASAGSVPAAIAGTLVIGYINPAAFRIIIGVALLPAAVLMFVDRKPPSRNNVPSEPPESCGARKGRGIVTGKMKFRDGTEFSYRYNIFVLLLFGIFKGFFAGLTGIAGGTILSPFMIVAMRIPVAVAAATTQFTIIFTSSSGSISNLVQVAVRFDYAIPLAAGVVAGSILGARLVRRVRGKVIRRALSIVIFAVAVRMLLAG